MDNNRDETAPTNALSVRVRRVPLPVNGTQRQVWKVGAVLFVLDKCHGKRASAEQLHTLVWSLESSLHAQKLLEHWSSARSGAIFRKFSQDLGRSIKVAATVELISLTTSLSVKLTPAGRLFAKKMTEDGVDFGEAGAIIASLAPITAKEMAHRLGGSF